MDTFALTPQEEKEHVKYQLLDVSEIDKFLIYFYIQGDSGGPLIFNGALVGVTSFGAAAGCEAGYADAFSRVSYFREWIKEKTGV